MNRGCRSGGEKRRGWEIGKGKTGWEQKGCVGFFVFGDKEKRRVYFLRRVCKVFHKI